MKKMFSLKKLMEWHPCSEIRRASRAISEYDISNIMNLDHFFVLFFLLFNWLVAAKLY